MTIEFEKNSGLKIVGGADDSSGPDEAELRQVGTELLGNSGLDYDEVAADPDFSREVREEWDRRRAVEAERHQLESETKKARALAAARAKRAELEQARQTELAAARARAEAVRAKLAGNEVNRALPADAPEPAKPTTLLQPEAAESKKAVKEVLAAAGLLQPAFQVAKKSVQSAPPPPQPTETEHQRVRKMEQSGNFPDQIFTHLDWLLALLWTLKNAFTARRCLVNPNWDVEKAYPVGACERERRIDEIETVRSKIDLDFNPEREGRIRDEMDELGLLMDQLSLIGFVCFQVRKHDLSRLATAGGVVLRNQVESLVRGYQCFARLGQLTYLPADLPCIQFKYQKSDEAAPPARRERLEDEAKALIQTAVDEVKIKTEAKKHAARQEQVDEMKAMLVAAGGFDPETALRLATRAEKKHGQISDGREKLIRLALGKLLYAVQLSGAAVEQEYSQAKKIAGAAGLNETEIDQRFTAHQAEEARKAAAQQQAGERAKSNVPTDWRTLNAQQRASAAAPANGQKKGKGR